MWSTLSTVYCSLPTSQVLGTVRTVLYYRATHLRGYFAEEVRLLARKRVGSMTWRLYAVRTVRTVRTVLAVTLLFQGIGTLR